jgi:RNA polymerase sigma-70 factor (ECF subfamily)
MFERLSMSTEPGESALLRSAIGGDAAALKTLLVQSYVTLGHYIASRIPPNLSRLIDPEDIIQEAHVEVFQRIGDFQPQGERSFERWVTTIALSRLRNAIERRQALKRGGERIAVTQAKDIEDSTIALLDKIADPGKTPSRVVARGEAVRTMQEALSQLPEHYQRALWLVHIEGCTVREAADRMDRTERAVHGLCHRGLRLLRQRLQCRTDLFSSTG